MRNSYNLLIQEYCLGNIKHSYEVDFRTQLESQSNMEVSKSLSKVPSDVNGLIKRLDQELHKVDLANHMQGLEGSNGRLDQIRVTSIIDYSLDKTEHKNEEDYEGNRSNYYSFQHRSSSEVDYIGKKNIQIYNKPNLRTNDAILKKDKLRLTSHDLNHDSSFEQCLHPIPTSLPTHLGDSHLISECDLKSGLSSEIIQDLSFKDIDNNNDAFPVKTLGFSNKLSQRNDVINKTILRQLKKYYAKRLRNSYDYMRRRRRITIQINSQMFSNAESFVTKEFRFTDLEYIYLVALVDVKKKYMHTGDEFESFRDKFHQLTKSYSKLLEDDVLSIPQFARLVHVCLGDPEFTSKVLERARDVDLRSKYVENIEILKNRCLTSIK